MFEGFKPFTITTQSDPKVDIYGLSSGDASSSSLPPLLLVHGFPQTHHIWHLVVPQLTSKYTVVLMEIRGYGRSSTPPDLAAYAKSAMARDCISVMDALGFGAFFVCAHDRGVRVAHKL
ncbi:Alpha/Beta hydrolase protein [Mycena maculata]|uniref:Alpha/Beta hydrolase protein n=1 Tax=Mycena maculata TaxID=230809 RepID=A0AAD7NI17_9AGAR|nr:Alpha/Beta hydrolase protein [Mycena maculata]